MSTQNGNTLSCEKKALLDLINPTTYDNAFQETKLEKQQWMDDKDKRDYLQKFHDECARMLCFAQDNKKVIMPTVFEQFHTAALLHKYLNDNKLEDINTAFSECLKIMQEIISVCGQLDNEKDTRRINIDKRVKFARGIIMAFLIMLAVTAVVLTVLDACSVIGGGLGDVVGKCIGAVDLALGIGFFVYEMYSDSKKQKNEIIVEKANEELGKTLGGKPEQQQQTTVTTVTMENNHGVAVFNFGNKNNINVINELVNDTKKRLKN